jgi:hypothetical protein
VQVASDSTGASVTFGNNSAVRGNAEYKVTYGWNREAKIVTRLATGSSMADFVAGRIIEFAPTRNADGKGVTVRITSEVGKRRSSASVTVASRIRCSRPLQSAYYTPRFWCQFWSAYPWGVKKGEEGAGQ